MPPSPLAVPPPCTLHSSSLGNKTIRSESNIQQIMQQPRLPSTFKIEVDKLENQFECQICCNPIIDCFVTRCGHVYCKGCIEETVGRHHRCPFCTQELKDFKSDVFKNYHFNTLKKIVDQQRKKETEKYLNKVFATDLKSKMEEESEKLEALMKPVEDKIVQHCQEALLRYRKFMLKLYEVEKEAEEKKVLLGAMGVRDHELIILNIQTLILNSLTHPILSPDVIEKPTQVELLLPGNKINKNTIMVSPLSTFESLLPYIQNVCSENNIMLRGKMDECFIINGTSVKATQRFGLLAGQTIKISGGIPFQQKVFCFTYHWEKGRASDFFNCLDCQVKWVCESCALFCHAGHETKIQLKQHTSEKPICYCVSKCDCKALNKNSME